MQSQCVIADNLCVHSISGFVESFSGQYTCRFCLGQCSDYQLNEVHTGAFQRSTKEEHAVLVLVQTVLQDPSLIHSFGVKKLYADRKVSSFPCFIWLPTSALV